MRSPILDLEDDDDIVEAPKMESAPEISQKTSNSRASMLLQRILSTPIVSFFTCGDVNTHTTKYFQGSIKKGAPIAVVQTMKQFPRNVQVQRMGCGRRGPGQAQKNCQHLGTLRYVGIFVKINLGAQKTIVVFIYLFRIRRDRNKKGGAMTAFSF